MNDPRSRWQNDAEKQLGSPFTTLRAVGGGDFAESYCAQLEDGRTVFIKTHTNPPPHFFSTEAAGLAWLRAAGHVRVPQVLGVSDETNWLALEWIDVGGHSRAEGGEASFGRALAALHQTGAAHFGRDDRRTTGSLGLPNEVHASWATFYADCRLRPLAQLAAERQALAAPEVRAIENIADRLAEYGAADEPPARLHGDLWAGNRVIDTSGQSWILDPAAHAGHREFDLAMMRLFGGFDDEVFIAYHDVSPLAEGWQQRVSLHQLAPLIVHAIKFGGGYVPSVREAIRRYV